MEDTKTAAGLRTVTLPKFAVDVLTARYGREYVGEQTMLFRPPRAPGATRTTFGKGWRSGREALGVPAVTPYLFRKTVATLIDDGGLSARIGADQLGHSEVSTTQDRYMARGRVHTEVADLLDRAINAE